MPQAGSHVEHFLRDAGFSNRVFHRKERKGRKDKQQ